MNHLFLRIYGVSAFLGVLLLPFAFAHASGTASIQNLSPGETVNVGTPISFAINTSGFTNPTFQLSDSFSGTSVAASDINYYNGSFIWTPIASDIGTHTITVAIQDTSGDSASVSQQIIVHAANAPALSIQDISPGSSIQAGQRIEFFAEPLNYSESSVTYFASDSFSSTSVNSSDMLPSGEFAWTPTENDVGTHIITLTAQDPAGDNSNAQLQVTVTPASGVSTASATSALGITIQSLSSSTATPGQQVTFSVPTTGFTNPTYTLSDSFSGSTISNADINSLGNFSWTPSSSDVGTHTITIEATSASGQTASVSQTIVVQGSGLILSGISSGSTVAVGSPLSFAVTSPSLTSPTYTIFDTYGGSTVANADITTSGQFMWTPAASDVGTHTLVITGTDSEGHTASTKVSLVVVPSSTTVVAEEASSTPVVAATAFTSTLSVGSQSAEVTALQNYLMQAGFYTGSITGYYGTLTEAAVKKFQTAHGIEAIGIVGPQTLVALQQVSGSASSTSITPATFTSFLTLGSKGTEVTELQQKLTSLGLYSGPVTGYFGSLTQTAVRQFQSTHGIPTVGTVGPETRTALNTL